MSIDHEALLAWDLADALSPVMAQRDRVTVCVHLGAGEQFRVILDLLRKCVDNQWPVPVEILDRTRLWARGFKDTEHHTAIHALIDSLFYRHYAARVGRPRWVRQ